ncbi:NAD(P)-dependent oxidoreductase [Mangrovibacillus cuniculi]|uniref:NAD(P)H-binding protein n=1 Tax=Mangrovibacillus cuniculi TaxID=2593652 RepID=A0A7S8C9Q1_9BACI|nr:NAD(P)H-binding protein [Mangrovibacillus cuniculi]QPC45957.1 NAD(P)H-binding protein [Mangrovibacillus cuniculi]
MKVALFGATGRVGQLVHQKLGDANVEVTALVRDPSRLHSPAKTIVGDARNYEKIVETLQDADAVISCLSTDKSDVLSDVTPKLIRAMKHAHLQRIITIGTAGILQSREEPRKLRFQTDESKRGLTRASLEHEKAWQALLLSNLDWTIVCPTYLPDGEEKGTYRVEENFLPLDGKLISTADTANFVCEVFKKQLHSKKRVGISY